MPLATLPNPIRSAALVLIDVQTGFDDPTWGERNQPEAEAHMAQLLGAWRASGAPVFHVRHDSTEPRSTLRPDQPGNAIKPIVEPLPGEPVIPKQVNSAFIGTDLEARLRALRITDLVIAGLTTPHCVSTSTRMAGNLGFRARVVADATAAFALRAHDGSLIPAAQVHFHALAALHGEFAQIVQTDEVLAALS